MEGVFQSPTSTTELNFAQDSKRTSSEVNPLIMPLSEARSNNSTNASNLRSSRPLGDITSKLQSIASMSRLRSSNENTHGGFCTTSQLKSNFQAATERLKTLTKDEENVLETSMHIADEQKNQVERTVHCEDWRPSVGTQRNLSHRSRTPLTMTSKGDSTSRKENLEMPTPRMFLNESGPIVESATARPKSPGLSSQYYSSRGERYFQVSTGRIVEKGTENRSMSTLKRTSNVHRAPSMKLSKSRAGESAQNSFSSSSMKKMSRMDSLKDIKLVGSPNASSGARLGINIVKETLEEVLVEKDTLKAQVEQLRNAIREEKATIEKLNENMRHYTTSMDTLSKKNENLDKSTTNTQTLVGRTLDEVCQMQEEVNSYMEALTQINEQIEVEREAVKQNKEQTTLLKAYVAAQTKDKESLKNHLELSRHSRKKSQEKYQNTEKTHTAFATVLEDQFRRYAE